MLRARKLSDRNGELSTAWSLTLTADVDMQGVKVPEVLRKYIPGAPEHIEYMKELPKDTTSSKAKVKATGPKAMAQPSTSAATEEMNKLKI